MVDSKAVSDPRILMRDVIFPSVTAGVSATLTKPLGTTISIFLRHSSARRFRCASIRVSELTY